MNNDVLKKFVRTLESEGKLKCKSLEEEEKFRKEFINILKFSNISEDKRISIENHFEDLIEKIKEDFFEIGILTTKE